MSQTQALGVKIIPTLSIRPDGSVDNKHLVSTVNALQARLVENSNLLKSSRLHWGLHAKRVEDSAGNTVVELTIASGVITATQTFHRVDTESDGASDDLDTINGGAIGDIVILMAENDTRDVVVKDGTGNLKTAGDFTMDDSEDKIILIKSEANEWHEIARSSNA